MSKLILNTLNLLKPLIKPKGLIYDKYGVVKDGVLYFGNGFVQVEIPIDIPFNCCIDLYQLQTLLANLKGETVIVNRDGNVYVHCDNTDYNIETLPIDSLNKTVFFLNVEPNIKCEESPFIFKLMCKIAKEYVQPIANEQNVDFISETMLVHNGTVICTDKFNIIQGRLDFNMPTMALPLSAIVTFLKISAKDIVGMDLINEFLLIKFADGMKFYMPNLAIGNMERVLQAYTRVAGMLDKIWELPNIEIPISVKHQIKLLNKVSLQNVVYFNNTFCQANNSQIHYSSFTDELFAFKCVYRHLKVAFENGNLYKVSEKGMSFLSAGNFIRGYIGKVLDD